MKRYHQHFHMSKDYALHSTSQKLIGRSVIQQVTEMAKALFENPPRLKVLDIACGPGNLTLELLDGLEKSFPTTKIDLAGLDYSVDNVMRLMQIAGSRVQGIVGSFYEFPPGIKEVDIVFSNEGLHWQPPYPMTDIVYTWLGDQERAKYEAAALQNFKTALRNIHGVMKPGAIAILQFGHEGQLKNLWNLIQGIFNEDPFQLYKGKINFPIWHPPVAEIDTAIKDAGFKEENINIKLFTQDQAEDTPFSVTRFFRAVSEPGFSHSLNQIVLESFYKKMEEKLNDTNMNEFRKGQWRRTLVKLKK